MSYDKGESTNNNAIVDDVQEDVGNKRPTFLTVLCIITFVISGFSIFGPIGDLFVGDNLGQEEWEEVTVEFENAAEGMDGDMQEFMYDMLDSMGGLIAAYQDNYISIAAIGLVAVLLSLLGAFWMFKLQKKGYYTYIASKVIGVFGPVAILGFSTLAFLFYSMGLFAAVVFIVLYGTQRKYMS